MLKRQLKKRQTSISSAKIKVEFTHDEICELIMMISIRAMGGGLEKIQKIIVQKLSKALKTSS